MMKRYIGENPSVTKKACEEINCKISSTAAKYTPIAKISTSTDIILVDESCVPNTSKATSDLKNIIKKYSLIPA